MNLTSFWSLWNLQVHSPFADWSGYKSLYQGRKLWCVFCLVGCAFVFVCLFVIKEWKGKFTNLILHLSKHSPAAWMYTQHNTGILHQQKNQKQCWSDKNCQTTSDSGPTSTRSCLQQWQVDVSTFQRMERKACRGSLPVSGTLHTLQVPGNPTKLFSSLQELQGCNILYLMQLCCDESRETNLQIKFLVLSFQTLFQKYIFKESYAEATIMAQ